jgi:hypothetical protein
MGITTDFNVSPYYDDFNEDKNFHKVLFKPAVAVQARELTQLQTILQNQVERFGENILVEGSIVKGGNFVESTSLAYVKLLDLQSNGQPVVMSNYVNLYALGSITGVKAVVELVATGLESQGPDSEYAFCQVSRRKHKGWICQHESISGWRKHRTVF